MKPSIVIIGAGTAGLTIANRLARQGVEATVTLIDPADWHVYQPGLLLVPFGHYEPDKLRRPIPDLVLSGVNLIRRKATKIDPKTKTVSIDDGTELTYNFGIVATGTRIAPEEISGMTGPGWRDTIFDFYTWEGAWALRNKLTDWEGGKLVMHITEMPIKCPVAPLEFCLLVDDYLKQKGRRGQTEITFVTPLSGAFTKPVANRELSHLLKDKDIAVVSDFGVERIAVEKKKIISYDEREVSYDLLVTVPTNMGSKFVIDSKIGDELGFVATNPHTLEAEEYDDLFVVGDASNVATSKAGSVAHFEVDVVVNRIIDRLAGSEPEEEYDGHTNCFVATGGGKALLLDFNYEVEPVSGVFPWPFFGPLKLLRESRVNWWAKLLFRHVYWRWLVAGKAIPLIPTKMPMAGKKLPRK